MNTTTATKQKPVEAEVLKEAPPASPLVLVAAKPAETRQGFANLAAALAAAQQKCNRVTKASRNDYHRYDYASSEAVIEAAQNALAGTGLSLLPLEQSLNGWERAGENRFELSRKFLLLHGSGESLPLHVSWPVCPEKGRPLDKATAIAATLSLAYLLRDLLLMPRVSPEDEVNARDDTKVAAPKAQPQASAAKTTAPAAPQAAPATPKAEGKKPEKKAELPSSGKELLDRLAAYDGRLFKSGLIRGGELVEAVRFWGARQGYRDDITKFPPESFADVAEEVKLFEAAARQRKMDAAAPKSA